MTTLNNNKCNLLLNPNDTTCKLRDAGFFKSRGMPFSDDVEQRWSSDDAGKTREQATARTVATTNVFYAGGVTMSSWQCQNWYLGDFILISCECGWNFKIGL